MPAEGEPIGSCGGAPGNEPAYPRPGAPAHETGPNIAGQGRAYASMGNTHGSLGDFQKQ